MAALPASAGAANLWPGFGDGGQPAKVAVVASIDDAKDYVKVRADYASGRTGKPVTAVEVIVNGSTRQVQMVPPATASTTTVTVPLAPFYNDMHTQRLKIEAKIYSSHNHEVARSRAVIVTLPDRVVWAPDPIAVEGLAGTDTSLELTLTSKVALSKVSLRATGELAKLVAVEADGLTDIAAGVAYVLPATVTVPDKRSGGKYTGTIEVRSDGRVMARASMKVTARVATSNVVPSTSALPSEARIASLRGVDVAKDELIVGLGLGLVNADQRIKDIASQTHAVIMGSVPSLHLYQLRYQVASLDQLEAIRGQVAGLADVQLASPDPVSAAEAAIPDDPKFNSWDEAHPAGNNWSWEYIKAPSAWDITTGSPNVRMGVIDARFNSKHEDLVGNIVATKGYRSETNAITDAIHGSMVAGPICASGNNGKGIAGMNWRCALSNYSVGFTHGEANEQDSRRSAIRAVEMMQAAANDDMQVVNMSLQWIDNNDCTKPGNAQTEQDARLYDGIFKYGIEWAKLTGKDVLWVFAAGNECRDVKYSAPASIVRDYPDNTMAVAAIDQTGGLWDESFLGKQGGSDFGSLITVAAPGKDIYTTSGTTCFVVITNCGPQYTTASGTSLAAPFVSGLAGLVLAKHPDMSAGEVRQCIVNAANTYGKPVPGQSFHVISAPEAVRCFPPSSVPCVFGGGHLTQCESTDPTVTVQATYRGDTSDCTYGVHAVWGDGTASDYTLPGSATDKVATYGSHTYKQLGLYHISLTGSLVSGLCTAPASASETFALLPE